MNCLLLIKGKTTKILNIEDLSDEELKVLKKFYSKISAIAEKEHPGEDITISIEEDK